MVFIQNEVNYTMIDAYTKIEAGAVEPHSTGVCEYYCPDNYFSNMTNRECEICSAGCYDCTSHQYKNSDVCLHCEQYALLNETTNECDCTFPHQTIPYLSENILLIDTYSLIWNFYDI